MPSPLDTTLAAPRAPGGERPQRDASVAAWLLHGPAQLAHGPHAGAIAGTVTAAAGAAYVYPEIAGYYLQWLAWRSRRDGSTAVLTARAAGVQRWLGTWLAATPPLTRVHLDGTTDDWRNRAVFFFDVAMVLRGLASAVETGLVTADPAVLAGIVRELDRLVAGDGHFDACTMHAAGDSFPAKWSTRRGAFLAKAAAGLITAARVLPQLPARLVDAAEATFTASVAALAQDAHRETHPLLYACEGVLALPGHRRFHAALPVVAAHCDTVLAAAGNDGSLPETLGSGAGPRRVDVIAQAMRVAALLARHRPQRPPDRVAQERLHRALVREIRPSGAVAFARDADGSACNVWAAMFADQALAFAAAAGSGADDGWRTDPLLV
ncbi:MAG: hypothetical protein U1F10_03795 [Burkholderiales bacterium]